jgi:hypothetical protein
MLFRSLLRTKSIDVDGTESIERKFNQGDWRFRYRWMWVMNSRTLELLAVPSAVASLILFALYGSPSILRAANQYALARKIDWIFGVEPLLILASSLLAFAVSCLTVAIASGLKVEIETEKKHKCAVRYVWHDPETISVHLDGDFVNCQEEVEERIKNDSIFLLEVGVNRIELLSPVLVGKDRRVDKLERDFSHFLCERGSNAIAFVQQQRYGYLVGVLIRYGWRVKMKRSKRAKAMPWRTILSTSPYIEAGIVIQVH